MKFEVRENPGGVELDGPTGSIRVDLEPTQDYHDIIIMEPGSGTTDDQCKITGDTYQHKEKIKKLPYGDKGTAFSGDWWEVHKSMVTELVAVLKIAAIDLCVKARAIVWDEDWGRLRDEIEIDEGPGQNESIKLLVGPDEPVDGVSRSWAEEAATVGNYDSAEEFADEFNLNIVDDDEMENMVEQSDEIEKDNVFSTE